MMAEKRPLLLHYERLKSSARCQIGHFAQVLPLDEAQILARIGMLFGALDSNTVKGTIAVHCASSDASKLLHAARDHASGIKWHMRDSRRGISRTLGLGAVSVTRTAHSLNDIAEGLHEAWPAGRVIVGLGSSEAQEVDTTWLEEMIEPPDALLASFRCLLVSFFHGDHVDIYGEGVFEGAIELAAGLFRASGREVVVSPDPL